MRSPVVSTFIILVEVVLEEQLWKGRRVAYEQAAALRIQPVCPDIVVVSRRTFGQHKLVPPNR